MYAPAHTINYNEFKKAPSNRGLRHSIGETLNHVDAIQKSPIKSGIKTLTVDASIIVALNSKKPHQIGD